jgi:hypothetical protein
LRLGLDVLADYGSEFSKTRGLELLEIVRKSESSSLFCTSSGSIVTRFDAIRSTQDEAMIRRGSRHPARSPFALDVIVPPGCVSNVMTSVRVEEFLAVSNVAARSNTWTNVSPPDEIF